MIGETFGNYRLVVRLGSGTMGTVFVGEHERIVRRAAVKILAPELALAADILDRFFEEARATSLIQHPAIVEIVDCGIHPDGRRPYIVMQYLEGETLAAHLGRSGPLGWRDACRIARQMAEGLAAAHHHGIVHRDVKPANVMLLGTGDTAPTAAAAPVKLLDFGVAKLLHEAQAKRRTCPGALLGTPEYMAPEQCGGEGGIGAHTDVYALGCVLFEMICGRLPFQADALSDILVAHRWQEAPAASAFAELPRPLDRLIAKMLAKRPSDRPADMPSVVRALTDLLTPHPATAIVPRTARPPVRAQPPPPARRVLSRFHAITATIGLLALLAMGVQLSRRAEARRTRALEVVASVPARAWAAPLPVAAPVDALPLPTASVPERSSLPGTAPSPRLVRPTPAPRRTRPASAPSARSAPAIDTDGIVRL